MVTAQLERRGIADPRVLEAMIRVPRHRFVEVDDPALAYGDHPLPIGHRQTISQPYMVARMTEICCLSPGDRVLEVGAGSGYQTAVLAELCAEVYATEIIAELADGATSKLTQLGYDNVVVAHRDGSTGWSEHAPYDVILVAAGAPRVPEPLKAQLVDGGRLVIPIGGRLMQVLQCWRRQGGEWHHVEDTACRFVDLHGEHGWG